MWVTPKGFVYIVFFILGRYEEIAVTLKRSVQMRIGSIKLAYKLSQPSSRQELPFISAIRLSSE